jgi:hypothetical protein
VKRIVLLTTTVLTIACASQAAVVSTFDNLAVGNLNGQTDGTATWTAITNRRTQIQIVADPNDPTNRLLQASSTRRQQTLSIPTIPGDSLFDLSAADTSFSISYTGTMSNVSGFLVGLWRDGVDSTPNGSTGGTVAQELALEFGVDATSGAWRLVGAGGSNDLHTSTLGLASVVPKAMAVTLTVDLLGNGGNGSATLTVVDLATDTTFTPYANVSLGLLANPGYSDPTQYTGWYLENSQVDASPQRGTQLYAATLDSLTLNPLTVIPEPASLSILLAGVLVHLVWWQRKK